MLSLKWDAPFHWSNNDTSLFEATVGGSVLVPGAAECARGWQVCLRVPAVLSLPRCDYVVHIWLNTVINITQSLGLACWYMGQWPAGRWGLRQRARPRAVWSTVPPQCEPLPSTQLLHPGTQAAIRGEELFPPCANGSMFHIHIDHVLDPSLMFCSSDRVAFVWVSMLYFWF